MAIRITMRVNGGKTVLKVDGRLKAEDVEEFNRVWQSVQGATALDLRELQSADEEGMAVLRELTSSGVEICGITPYFELLMKTKP